jgi:hypothetical protein
MSKNSIILFSILALAMVLAIPGNIKAQTASDIQNQINQLLAQVAQLETQLSQLNNQQYSYYNQQYPYSQNYQNIPVGFTFTQDLYPGTANQDVVYLRQVLVQDGCLDASNGTSQYFDSAVQSAVMCFQQKHNPDIYRLVGYHVLISGNVGPGTRAGLNNLVATGYGYNNYNNNNNNNNYPYNYNNYQNYSGSLAASCYASPNTININQPANFIVTATGGAGYYTYNWSGACTGSSSTCYSSSFSNSGTYTAYVTVTSNGQSISVNCPVTVNNNNNYNYSGNLTASCYASPSSIQAGQAGNFVGTASGGNGNYTYSWSGACNGGTSSCYNILSTSGTYTAYLTVTSNGQTAYANCPITVGGYNNSNNNSGISCIANPSTTRVNQPVNFTVALPVGMYPTSYSWTGACTGSSSVCYATFPGIGSYSTTVTVYMNGQYSTANCSAYVNSY